MLKAVIFDLDGVIADSHPLHYAAWKTLLNEQDRDVTESEMDFILAGHPRREILRHYLGDLPQDQMDTLGKRKEELYRGSVHRLHPMPGLLTLFDELEAAGIAKAVATSATPERTWETLKSFNIDQRFSAVLTGGDSKPKPNPEIFLLAAARAKVNTDEALVIEDSAAGVQAAKAAGMRCVGYTSEARFTILSGAGADQVISAFTPGLLLQFQEMFSNRRAAVPTSS